MNKSITGGAFRGGNAEVGLISSAGRGGGSATTVKSIKKQRQWVLSIAKKSPYLMQPIATIRARYDKMLSDFKLSNSKATT